ncbi:MAG: acyltransferase family protein [Bacteroidales bacterium]|nr:acyltransferase family protein [Bacteroidales bacterium]
MKERQSNMELLRILAMLMILVLHINIGATGRPSVEQCAMEPLNTWMRYFFQCLAEPAVNIFVLISGWFGIRFRVSRLAGLFFQCIFFALLIWLAACIFGFGEPMAIKNLASLGLFTMNIWFVKSYIILYILSPLLNAFIDRAGKGQLALATSLFMGFALVYGWTDAAPEFVRGNSALSFVGLYLVARYIRLYMSAWVERLSAWICLAVFLLATTANSLLSYVVTAYSVSDEVDNLLHVYLNPFNLVAAVAMLLCFSKLKFQSRFINGVAVSCLAVFLFHKNSILGPFYGSAGWYLFTHFSGPVYVLLCLAFIVLVFAASVLIDRVRIACWKPLEKWFIQLGRRLPDLTNLETR